MRRTSAPSPTYAERWAPASGLRTAVALRQFGFVRGQRQVVARDVRRLLDHPDAAGTTRGRGRGRGRARALLLLVRLSAWTTEAAEAAREGLAIAIALGDEQVVADFTLHLALVSHDLLRRYRALGDRAGEAAALNGLGVVAYFGGDLEAAAHWNEQSHDIETELGNVWGIASRSYNLGIIAKRSGDHAAAAARYRRALAMNLALGDRYSVAYTVEGLACLASAASDARRAAMLWGAVEAERRRSSRTRHGRELVAFESDVAEARAQVEPDVFGAAWEHGLRRGLDAIIGDEMKLGAVRAFRVGLVREHSDEGPNAGRRCGQLSGRRVDAR